MIRILATLALLVLCSPVFAQAPPGFPKRPAPYRRRSEVDRFELVEVVDFKTWAIEQNEIAYENAERLRDEVNSGIGGTVSFHFLNSRSMAFRADFGPHQYHSLMPDFSMTVMAASVLPVPISAAQI